MFACRFAASHLSLCVHSFGVFSIQVRILKLYKALYEVGDVCHRFSVKQVGRADMTLF